MASFVVGRNPDADSSLPYLIRFALGSNDVVLKARETWPRTAKVYCHRAEGWPDDIEIVEEVPLRSCARRGPAVDLVLDRSRENRSQLVFVTSKDGRELIFWQTARTSRMARPGLRVPTRRVLGHPELRILVDTRERYPYKFARQQVVTERRALPVGDYGVEADGQIVAVVERKSIADLAGRLIDGSIAYTLADLSALWRSAVVVEDRYSEIYKLARVTEGFVPDLVARLSVRYPTVPIVFCDNRKSAEQWSYRFLGAALSEWRAALEHPLRENGATVSRPGGRGRMSDDSPVEEGRGSEGQGAG